MNDYNYLFYVRRYSIFSNKTELYVYGANTKDFLHTIGEMYFRTLEHIERIDPVELTPENRKVKFDYWEEQGIKIQTWYDKYKI